MRNLATYHPPATQRLRARSAELAKGKPYERYFDADLWLHDEVIEAIAHPPTWGSIGAV